MTFNFNSTDSMTFDWHLYLRDVTFDNLFISLVYMWWQKMVKKGAMSFSQGPRWRPQMLFSQQPKDIQFAVTDE